MVCSVSVNHSLTRLRCTIGASAMLGLQTYDLMVPWWKYSQQRSWLSYNIYLVTSLSVIQPLLQTAINLWIIISFIFKLSCVDFETEKSPMFFKHWFHESKCCGISFPYRTQSPTYSPSCPESRPIVFHSFTTGSCVFEKDHFLWLFYWCCPLWLLTLEEVFKWVYCVALWSGLSSQDRDVLNKFRQLNRVRMSTRAVGIQNNTSSDVGLSTFQKQGPSVTRNFFVIRAILRLFLY